VKYAMWILIAVFVAFTGCVARENDKTKTAQHPAQEVPANE
jgi:hypothetical protein